MSNVFRSTIKFKALKGFYRVEDRCARLMSKYPLDTRKDSFPFLSSDTYYFLADLRIENLFDISSLKHTNENSTIYLNGNSINVIFSSLIEELQSRNIRFQKLIIGDSDFSPSLSQIDDLSKYFLSIYSVNLKETLGDNVYNLPLGLESQRYRSAGQLRDFRGLPTFDPEKRNIQILVAWNDKTFEEERVSARKTLAGSALVTQIEERVPARLVHKMMRSAKLIPSPRGNGLDTHRFWESLYLGALPIVLCKNKLRNMNHWPYVCVESWEELASWNKFYITEVYVSKVEELRKFRETAAKYLKHLQASELEL
jgi:hypothetical protein